MYAGLGAKVVVNDMSKDAAATVVDEITRCKLNCPAAVLIRQQDMY